MVESNFRRWKHGDRCPGSKSKTERDLYMVWEIDQKSWSTGFGRICRELSKLDYSVLDRKSTRLNSSHSRKSRMPSSA